MYLNTPDPLLIRMRLKPRRSALWLASAGAVCFATACGSSADQDLASRARDRRIATEATYSIHHWETRVLLEASDDAPLTARQSSTRYFGVDAAGVDQIYATMTPNPAVDPATFNPSNVTVPPFITVVERAHALPPIEQIDQLLDCPDESARAPRCPVVYPAVVAPAAPIYAAKPAESPLRIITLLERSGGWCRSDTTIVPANATSSQSITSRGNQMELGLGKAIVVDVLDANGQRASTFATTVEPTDCDQHTTAFETYAARRAASTLPDGHRVDLLQGIFEAAGANRLQLRTDAMPAAAPSADAPAPALVANNYAVLPVNGQHAPLAGNCTEKYLAAESQSGDCVSKVSWVSLGSAGIACVAAAFAAAPETVGVGSLPACAAAGAATATAASKAAGDLFKCSTEPEKNDALRCCQGYPADSTKLCTCADLSLGASAAPTPATPFLQRNSPHAGKPKFDTYQCNPCPAGSTWEADETPEGGFCKWPDGCELNRSDEIDATRLVGKRRKVDCRLPLKSWGLNYQRYTAVNGRVEGLVATGCTRINGSGTNGAFLSRTPPVSVMTREETGSCTKTGSLLECGPSTTVREGTILADGKLYISNGANSSHGRRTVVGADINNVEEDFWIVDGYFSADRYQPNGYCPSKNDFPSYTASAVLAP